MINPIATTRRTCWPARWRAGLLASCLFTGWLGSSAAVDLSPLAGISRNDQASSLRLALTQGAQSAVGKLGVADGFFGNPEVRIPLPGKLKKAESALRMLGYGSQVDSLVQSMNRAAEAAVPEAKVLLVDSIRQMSITDAAAILTGGPDSATQYFRRTTSAKLTEKVMPIVKRSTSLTVWAPKVVVDNIQFVGTAPAKTDGAADRTGPPASEYETKPQPAPRPAPSGAVAPGADEPPF